MGTAMHQQHSSKPVLEIVRQMRGAARHGRLVREEWDHNHPNYSPERSNKQLKIAAAMVLGLGPNDDLPFERAWSVMAELAFG